MNPYDLICNLDEQIINLKAELTYWKETAEYYKNESNKILDK